MVAATLPASSAFASPRATSTTSSTVRPSPLTTTVRMATACHPRAPTAAAGLATPPVKRKCGRAREGADPMSHGGRPRRLGNMRTMTIAIVGGTGTLGRQVAAELEARGNRVRPLSRHAPEYRVDLATGDGLGPALAGCDVVVDASNSSARKPAGILVDGSRRLLEAEAATGVKHHVCVSIVGCDQVPMGYYRAKSDQERVVG